MRGQKRTEIRERITNLLKGQNPFSYKNLHFWNKRGVYLSFEFGPEVQSFFSLFLGGDLRNAHAVPGLF